MVDIATLSNGLTVIVDTVPSVETCAVGFWTETGSRDEDAREHGVCHLLEHMAFKGTASRSARQIAEAVEDVGGVINAATGFERTGFFIRIMKNDVRVAVDLLGDIVTDSIYDPTELGREKQVVLQEIAEAEDVPEDRLFDHLQARVFDGQALGRPILGTRKSVMSHDADRLRDFHRRHVRADNSVLSISGAVRAEDFIPMAEAAFARLGGAQAVPPRRQARFCGGRTVCDKDDGHTHLAFAWPAPGGRERDRFAARIMGEIFGGGMSSRLFQSAREREALCYTIFSFVDAYVDNGVMGVYAACEPDRAGALEDLVHTELADLAESVSKVEVTRAKAQLRAGIAMAMESMPARAEGCAGHFLRFGEVMDPADIARQVDAVTIDDVKRLAAAAFNGPYALALLGPGAADPERAGVAAGSAC